MLARSDRPRTQDASPVSERAQRFFLPAVFLGGCFFADRVDDGFFADFDGAFARCGFDVPFAAFAAAGGDDDDCDDDDDDGDDDDDCDAFESCAWAASSDVV